jgi:uncharacterized protein YdeI (YjbR/CyaY-like superfamily)
VSAAKAKSFSAVLEPLQNGLGWVIARVPFDIAKVWPVRRGVRVRGEIEGFAFRTSLMGAAAESGHFILVNKKMQAAAKARVGSKVRITLEPDLEERVAAVPPELAKALKGDRMLRKWFDGLSNSMRRWFGDQVSAAKSAEAREARAERIAEWLMLTMEGELDPKDPPPVLRAAFQRQPRAQAGWEALSPAKRRHLLLGVFHVRGIEARARRVAAVVATCGGADAR